MKKIYIIIPVYNEAPVIKHIIHDIKKEGYKNIIVVDDGSTDETYSIARKENKITLQHFTNRGKGAAIRTGFEAAKLLCADAVITMDGDGQHTVRDIRKMIEKMEEGYDVVLGARNFRKKYVPLKKIAANYIANICTWLLYGFWVLDSQCGFRAYSKKALRLINTKNDRYEYDSEILAEIKRNKLSYIEMPVRVYYTSYSMGKKDKQSFSNGLKTVFKLALTV